VGYSAEYRKVAYFKIIEAVQTAVAERSAQEATTVIHAASEAATNEDTASPDQQFRDAVLRKYASIASAWNVFDGISTTPGQLTRGDWKTVLKILGLKMTRSQQAAIRKKMDPAKEKL
jgi:hypothetical protein